MLHDQHVLTNGMYLPFCFFYVLPRASYGYIQCGFIPSAVWMFSNYYCQLPRCRNLALYRFFLIFPYWQVCFTLGGSVHAMYVWKPHMFGHPLTFRHPQCPYVQTPLCPLLPVHLYVLGISACDMGIWGPSCLDTPYVFGCLPMCPTPSHICMLPVCLYVLGVICMCYGKHLICWGSGGISTSVMGFWCLSVHPLDVHYASACTFLVVHYVSSLYCHGYDYYSSSDSGFFWYVISIISDHGCFFVGLPTILGSTWCGSAATPDTKMLWRCSWPCLCITAALSIFDASSGLCQLCHGFSAGSFFLRVEPPTILYIICLVSVLVSAFYFQVPCWMPYSPLGGSTIGVCIIATPWNLPVKGICATWWWSLAHTRYAENGCSLH